MPARHLLFWRSIALILFIFFAFISCVVHADSASDPAQATGPTNGWISTNCTGGSGVKLTVHDAVDLLLQCQPGEEWYVVGADNTTPQNGRTPASTHYVIARKPYTTGAFGGTHYTCSTPLPNLKYSTDGYYCDVNDCPSGVQAQSDGTCPSNTGNPSGGGNSSPSCNLPAHTVVGEGPGITRPADMTKPICYSGCRAVGVLTDIMYDTYTCTADHQHIDENGHAITPTNGKCQSTYSHYETNGDKCDTADPPPPDKDPNASDPNAHPPKCVTTASGRNTCFNPNNHDDKQPPNKPNCVTIDGTDVCLGPDTGCTQLPNGGGYSCTRKTPANEKPAGQPDASTSTGTQTDDGQTVDHYPPSAGKPADGSATTDTNGNSICGQPGVTCAYSSSSGGTSTPTSGGKTPSSGSGKTPSPTTGGTGSASGGATCSDAPSCSGNSVGCEQVQQEWLTRCDNTNKIKFQAPDSGNGVNFNAASFHMDDPAKQQKMDLQDKINNFQAADATPSSAIEDYSFDIFGTTIVFPLSKLMPFFIVVGTLFAASAMFFVFKLILRRGN